MTISFFPKENPTVSFWLSQPDEFSIHRSTEELPKEADIVIIGSGYAGTSVVTNLQMLNPDLKIAMFEARDVCSGATGRNGGHIKPYCHRNFDLYQEKWGTKGAAEIVNSEFEHLWLMKNIITDNEIDCDFFLTRACDIYPEKNDPRIAKDLKCFQMMMDCPLVDNELKKQIQVFHGDAARMISKNPTTDIAFTYPAASCWPWKLMTTLLKKCVAKGLNLQSNTPVISVKRQGDRWLVSTPRGSTICSKVVYCTNGYTKALLEEFNDAIVPQRGVCCSIKPKNGAIIPHLTNTYAIFSEKPVSDYLINRIDGTIIVGGHDSSMFTKSEKPLERIFNCVEDTCVDEESEKAFTENYMKEKFVTWKDTPVEVSHWTGILGFTNDYMPYVGELDCIGKENSYIVAGFHGHGMPRIWLSGKAVAKCIAEGKKINDIDYTCPTPFYITKERLEGENIYAKHLLASIHF
jgi:glycine/D-amino acid oxidase-like deaminating enzyme